MPTAAKRVDDLPDACRVVEAEPDGELDSEPAHREEAGRRVVAPGAAREPSLLDERLCVLDAPRARRTPAIAG